ncbi:MAG TPA: DNA oxidative demethylase AlkB [Methylotenera sp.]|jgi:alkylated DNA repair protein (DNA oxidative demethylase)
MDLFDTQESQEILKDVVLLRSFVAPVENEVLPALASVMQLAPLRHMMTPGGFAMSVATTSCGDLGWVCDKKGYRYAASDPLTGKAWPQMPASFKQLARQAASMAGFANFELDTCLINRYQVGARMGLHQDKDERDFNQPIVSVSLGLPAVFQMGGFARGDKALKLPLYHGDVLVWGGESRLRFHGVLPVKAGNHPALGECRINLTFRKAG